MKRNGALSAMNRWRSMAIICAAMMLSGIVSANAQRFINHGNGTITDTSSGLMWTQNSDLAGESLSYAQATAFVDSMTLYTDWRIPTRADFQSLFANAPGSDFFAMLTSAGFTGQWYAKTYWTSDINGSGTIPPGGYYRYYLYFRTEVSPIQYLFNSSQTDSRYLWPVRGAVIGRVIRLTGDLAFGEVQVGSSATRTLTIFNDGNSTLTVSSITYPAGFSGNWNGTIAAGGSRDVTVTFAPSAAQSYSGNLTVNSDKTSGTNSRAVSGNGYSPTRVIRLSGDLSFGDVAVDQTATRSLTIYNDGNSTLTVSSISYPSGFSGNWSGTIAAGGSRNVVVTFTPSALQSYSGNLTVNSDKTSGANLFSITGTGVPATRIIRFSGNLSMGEVAVGYSSSTTISIYNDGNAILHITDIAYPEGYTGVHALTVSPLSSVDIEIIFAPISPALYEGQLRVTSDSTDGSNIVIISGQGVPANKSIAVRGSMIFGYVIIGENAYSNLLIENCGNTPLNISGIQLPKYYIADWSGIMSPGATQSVTVCYSPQEVGKSDGLIYVTSDAVNGINSIKCTGTGTLCLLAASPSYSLFSSSGGCGTVTVAVARGVSCIWTGIVDSAWIDLLNSSPNQSESNLMFSVQENTGYARKANIHILNETHEVYQAPASTFLRDDLILDVIHSGEAAHIVAQAAAAAHYQIERTRCIYPADWKPIARNAQVADYMLSAADVGTEVHAFYRLKAVVPTSMIYVCGGSLSNAGNGEISTESYFIEQTPVTWALWRTVRDEAQNRGYDIGARGYGCASNHPVVAINWYDAVKWCNLRSDVEGRKPVYYVSNSVYIAGEYGSAGSSCVTQDLSADGYRLPTELQWEYAARGGLSSKGYIYSGGNVLNQVGWYEANSTNAACAMAYNRGTWPVKLKLPNELSIYDMSGNTYEWCWDLTNSSRAIRGGCWMGSFTTCKVTYRVAWDPAERYFGPGYYYSLNGMRVVLPMTP